MIGNSKYLQQRLFLQNPPYITITVEGNKTRVTNALIENR